MPSDTTASAPNEREPVSASTSRRTWILRATAALVSVGAICAAAVWLAANPALAAYLCPSCFGLERLQGQIWIEPRMTRAERSQLTSDFNEARTRVSAVYGPLQAEPVLLACTSDDCDRRIGGKGSRGATYGWHVARIAPRGRSSIVIAHELAHAELHLRIGWWGLLTGGYPAWFDEGLAVLVSRDPRTLDLTRPNAPRCRVVMSDADVARLPTTTSHWVEEMWRTRDLYARAGCVVARWYQAAGRTGLMALIDDLRSGSSFASAFAARGKR